MTATRDNAPPYRTGAISRIVAAHRRGVAQARDRTPELSRAFERALRHAAVPFRGLGLRPGEIAVAQDAPLSQALGDLPQHGLVAVLEDREGRRGLIALSHSVVDALIEVQTTGRVEPRDLNPRPVTRIDEALSRDFLDLSLAAFARETEGADRREWPDRMTYGSGVGDRAQLALLLPERGFHLLCAEVRLGEGDARCGRVVLALPAIRAVETGEAAADPPAGWREEIAGSLRDIDVTLEAVLCRSLLPLHEVEALAPGDLLHFDAGDLAAVSLEAAGGRRVLTGRLGQAGGRRALKICVPPGAGAAAMPEPSGPLPDLPSTVGTPAPLADGSPGAPTVSDDPVGAAAAEATLPLPGDPLAAGSCPDDHPPEGATQPAAPMMLDFAARGLDSDLPPGS